MTDTNIDLEKYTIQIMAHETSCGFCGWPMYLGDTCFFDAEQDETFCGAVCAQKYRQEPDHINDTGGAGLWN